MKNKKETVNNMSLKRHSIFFLFLLFISISGYSQKDILLNQTLYTPENVVAGDWIGHAKLNINENYQSTSFSIEDNSLVSIDNNGLITAKTSAIMNTTFRVDVETDKWQDHAFITIKVSEKSKSVFIDPTANNSSQAGTKENPITRWEQLTFAANTSYFIKRGTALIAPGTLIDDQPGILFGAYGIGNKPVISVETTVNCLKLRDCDGYVLSDLELTSSTDPNRILESYSNNFIINNCIISHAGMGMRGSGDDGKILYTTFHDVNRDGIYLTNNALNIEIGNCHFYNINMRYMENEPNTGYGEATGDAIQFESITCTGARIHHNIMDRHNTGHKFNLIINGYRDGVPSTDIIIEDNVFYGPKATAQQPGSSLYIAADDMTIRNNQILDSPTAYDHRSTENVWFYKNLIKNAKVGVMAGKNCLYVENNTFLNVDEVAGMWKEGICGSFLNNLVIWKNSGQKTGVLYGGVDIRNNAYNLMPDDNNSDRVIIEYCTDCNVIDALGIDQDYIPLDGSPLIDAGYNSARITTFEGTAPDIGAFEYGTDYTSHTSDNKAKNNKPIAHAGNNATFTPGIKVTLDGSKSSDPDGDELSFEWTAPSGITISSVNAVKPTFTAPNPDITTDYLFTLKVFDGEMYSQPATVKITVVKDQTNNQPVADAGSDKIVAPGTLVTLDASNSSDPDNDVITSEWAAPAGITLSSNNAIKPTFTAPDPDQTMDYKFILRVYDGSVYSIPDTVKITVTKEQIEEAQKLDVKHVEASAHDGNVPENTIDKSLNTRWSAEGAGENITYELSGMDEVRYIKTSFYKGDSRKAFFEVQISKDAIDWQMLNENLESSGQTEGFQYFDLSNIDARYIRIVGYGNSENDWNSINELEIYGIPEALKIENKVKKSLKAFPNPTVGNIKIDLSNISFTQGSLHVYNMVGSLVYKKNNIMPYESLLEINLEEYPNGMYIVKFHGDSNVEYINKIILQNPDF